jgi:DNA-binding transcriptional MerR regulator
VVGRRSAATRLIRCVAPGLLAPKRDASGYRRYGRDGLVRVAVVLRNKAAGMSLGRSGVLLDGEAEHGIHLGLPT